MIYTVENAPKGLRVFLNNKLVKYAFVADSEKGIVKSYRMPLKVHKHKKRCISKTMRGCVRFEL